MNENLKEIQGEVPVSTLQDTEEIQNYVKITFPITCEIRTYKTNANTITIGADRQCDLHLILPSINPVHIEVDFASSTFRVVGSDVSCDEVPIAVGTVHTFSNNSIISIHNIFMSFLQNNEFHSFSTVMEQSSDRIIKAASKYMHCSPYFKINNRDDSLIEIKESAPNNNRELNELYEKEMGEFIEMPIIPHRMNTDSTNQEETGAPGLYEKKDFCKQVAADIEKDIKQVESEFQQALDGINDIGVMRTHRTDLGESAIKNEVLQSYKEEIEEMRELEEAKIDLQREIVGLEKERLELEKEILVLENEKTTDSNKMLQAEIKSIDDLKTNITDTMKEEFRNTISNVIQEEAREQVEKEVEQCIQNSKLQQVIREVVKEEAKEQEDKKTGKSDKKKTGNKRVSNGEKTATEQALLPLNEIKEEQKAVKSAISNAKRKTSETTETEVTDALEKEPVKKRAKMATETQKGKRGQIKKEVKVDKSEEHSENMEEDKEKQSVVPEINPSDKEEKTIENEEENDTEKEPQKKQKNIKKSPATQKQVKKIEESASKEDTEKQSSDDASEKNKSIDESEEETTSESEKETQKKKSKLANTRANKRVEKREDSEEEKPTKTKRVAARGKIKKDEESEETKPKKKAPVKRKAAAAKSKKTKK